MSFASADIIEVLYAEPSATISDSDLKIVNDLKATAFDVTLELSTVRSEMKKERKVLVILIFISILSPWFILTTIVG